MIDETQEDLALLHSEFVWKLVEDKGLAITHETRHRLRDISVLLRHRPDIDMAGNFQFQVGSTYPTRGGKLVTIISKSESTGYECVQGDDATRPQGGYRYSRSTGTGDQGRATGSRGDCELNLLPIEITDPRITGAAGHRELLERKAEELESWLDSQLNETGEEPKFRNFDWMDRRGFTAGEIRAAKIAIAHLLGKDSATLRDEVA